MVFIKSKAIVLIIDHSLSIKFDSFTSITNGLMAVVKLKGDPFFLTVRLIESGDDLIWQINGIVKPLVSDIKIMMAETSRHAQCYRQDPNKCYIQIDSQEEPIELSQGQSQQLTDDIVIHLLSRDILYEPDSNTNVTYNKTSLPDSYIFAADKQEQEALVPERYIFSAETITVYQPESDSSATSTMSSRNCDYSGTNFAETSKCCRSECYALMEVMGGSSETDYFQDMRLKYTKSFLYPVVADSNSECSCVTMETKAKRGTIKQWLKGMAAGLFDILDTIASTSLMYGKSGPANSKS